MKTRLLFCVLIIGRLCVIAAPQEEGKYFFKDMAQAGNGIVWAIDGTRLYAFDGKEWAAQNVGFDIKEGEAAFPMRLASMRDGSIACVWQLPEERIAITRHTGRQFLKAALLVSHLHATRVEPHLATTWQAMGQCDGKIENSGLTAPPFADSHNRLWITDNKRVIYRADPDGHVSPVYTIKPEQFSDKDANHEGYVYATEDGRGRVWAWSNSWDGGMNSYSLRGVLIFEGDKARQQETFDGIQQARYSFIERKDDRHMWVAVIKEGLFSVDIDTMKAAPVAEPEPGAFQWTQKVFSSGGDLFVLASRTENIFKVALWRLHDGKWKCLIEDVDTQPNSYFDYRRSFARVGDHVVMVSFDAAPWVISSDAPPYRLDWRQGFADQAARRLFALNDGSLVADGVMGHWFYGAVSLDHPRASRATELIIATHQWITDSNGNAWAVIFGKKNVLSQWNGERWIEHPMPDEIAKWEFQSSRFDNQGRIWLMPRSMGPACFDPATGQWQSFPSMDKARDDLKVDPSQFTKDPLEDVITPKKMAPPAGSVTREPDSIAKDNQGDYWLTWEKKLYKCTQGKCDEMFKDGEPNPFADDRQILGAWVDGHGNVFLKTWFDKYVMITPPSSPAKPAAATEKAAPSN